jgi:hypothetical protein
MTPSTSVLRYKYRGKGKLALFTAPPQCLLPPLLPCPLRFTAGQRNREKAPPPLPSSTPALLPADVPRHRRRCRRSPPRHCWGIWILLQHACRRCSITAARSPVSSFFSILPPSYFSAALYRYHCVLRSSVDSKLGSSSPD